MSLLSGGQIPGGEGSVILVNRKYFRIFLIFLILFGAYQIYEIFTVNNPAVSGTVATGLVLLIAVIIGSALWFLKNTRK